MENLKSELQAVRTLQKSQRSFQEECDVHFGKVDDRITKLKLVAFFKPFGHQECK